MPRPRPGCMPWRPTGGGSPETPATQRMLAWAHPLVALDVPYPSPSCQRLGCVGALSGDHPAWTSLSAASLWPVRMSQGCTPRVLHQLASAPEQAKGSKGRSHRHQRDGTHSPPLPRAHGREGQHRGDEPWDRGGYHLEQGDGNHADDGGAHALAGCVEP